MGAGGSVASGGPTSMVVVMSVSVGVGTVGSGVRGSSVRTTLVVRIVSSDRGVVSGTLDVSVVVKVSSGRIVVVVKVIDGSVMVRGMLVAGWTKGIGMRISPSAGMMVVVRAATTGIVTGVGRSIVVTSGTATEVGGGGSRVVVLGPNK